MASRTEETVEAYRSGLTWRSFLALLYCSIVLMPAALFSDLVTGMGIAGAGYVAIFLAAEISRFTGSKMTRQELFMIQSHSGLAMGGIIAMRFIRAIYFRNLSPVTWAFFKEGKPLPLVIPDWYAPPPGSEVLKLRTLFHPEWTVPILVALLLMILTDRVLPAIKGFLLYQIFAVAEKLPFPISQVQAETAVILSTREKRKNDLMMIACVFSVGYSFATYFLPFALGLPQLIPIPWVDMTNLIERTLPGATIGIGTDILSFATGMILPFHVVINMLAASIAVWLIGNPILVSYGMLEYNPGMGLPMILQNSTKDFWAFPGIGLAVAAAVVPLVLNGRKLVSSLRGLVSVSGEYKKMGLLSVKYLILFYLVASGALLVVFMWLTQFPWYLLALLIFVWGFVTPMISVRALGETGLSISIPYIAETAILSSGYPKADIWFTGLPSVAGGGGLAGTFKVCELTKTTIGSWLKTWVIITPIAWTISFFYVEVFWKIAPIPSGTYPATTISWPVSVIQSSLWITGAVGLGGSQMLIASSFAIGAVISLLGHFLHLPISIISLAVGVGTPLPSIINVTIGALISQVFIRKMGVEAWRRDRITIVAGMFIGQSVIFALAVGVSMLTKSLWPLPY